MNSAENNLYEFYDSLGCTISEEDMEISDFRIISGKNGTWPQMIYKLTISDDPEESIVNVFELAQERKLPKYSIVNSEKFCKTHLAGLNTCNIFPVAIWQIMEKPLSEDSNKKFISDMDIREISKPSQISEFIELVNVELLRNNTVEENLFTSLLNTTNFKFFGIFIDDKIVSTIITFTKNNVAGLYFIATKNSHRGKGLASKLILYAINYLKLKGVQKVVLQSVQKAVPLYTKLGFRAKGKLIIFSKI